MELEGTLQEQPKKQTLKKNEKLKFKKLESLLE